MDPNTSQILGDWLPNSSPQRRQDNRPPTPRHLNIGALAVRPGAVWPISESVLISLQRSAALSQNAAWGYAFGQPDRLIDVARRAATERWSFLAPSQAVERALAEVLEGMLSDATRRAVVATLAQRLPHTLDRSLPRSILELYPHTLAMLADFLESDVRYDDDLFAKDIRLICGATVPAGAQGVDILFSSSVGSTLGRVRRTAATVVRLLRAREVLKPYKMLSTGGAGDWLQIHTDTRNVLDFNPEGWDRCYHRIADLLVAQPKLAGLLGISWFYDPQLPSISPRLGYLQERPLANGAFLVRLKASALDAERAGATSPTRRGLIEAGAYVPVCYALFWPRRDLLRWAHGVEREHEEEFSARLWDVA